MTLDNDPSLSDNGPPPSIMRPKHLHVLQTNTHEHRYVYIKSKSLRWNPYSFETNQTRAIQHSSA